MKFSIGLLIALVAINGVLALPARSPNDDAEVIDVPRRPVLSYRPIFVPIGAPDDSDEASDEGGFRDFKGVIDTGAGYPFLQSTPTFNLGFFDAFEDIFRRLRTRLLGDAAAAAGGAVGPDGSVGEPGGEDAGFGFNFDPSKANTTSTVKVVNGHKVEINQTVYGDDDTFYKVRFINIRPVDSGEEGAEGETNNEGGSATTVGPSDEGNKRDTENDSDEKREPLEPSTKDNEIRGNIDEHLRAQQLEQLVEQQLPEQTQQYEFLSMLPPMMAATTIDYSGDDGDVANLNAAFVTDNSVESSEGNGNIEAETNKPDNDYVNNYTGDSISSSNVGGAEDAEEEMEKFVVAMVAKEIAAQEVEQQQQEQMQSALLASEPLTIENNEEAIADERDPSSSSEVYDNYNESSAAEAVEAAIAEELAEELAALEMSGGMAAATADDSEDPTADAESDGEMVEGEVVRDAAQSHSNYKQREDVSSSDDESSSSNADAGEQFEMNPEFQSEWGSLREDLLAAKAQQDGSNDLSNDIDVYESVPVDLSNDIAVNDIAAAQPDYPINPDAEFIDVGDGMMASPSATVTKKPNATMPQFEKLSVSAAVNPTSYQPSANSPYLK